MKTFLTFFAPLVALLACTVNPDVQQPIAVNYTVSIDEANPRIAHVAASFSLADSFLFMAPGGADVAGRWSAFVHDLIVRRDDGSVIEVATLDDARWQLNAPVGTDIQLAYDIHLEHDQHNWGGGYDGIAYLADRGVFYTGRTMFIMNGEERTDLQLRFELPEGWQLTTPWQENGDSGTEFIALNHTDLANAMLFAGTHEEITFDRSGFELVLALGSESIISQQDEFRGLAEGVLDYYIELMGGIPRPAPDNPLEKVVVVINSSDVTDGEVVGNCISILMEKDGDDFAQTISRFIFAHEFFHLWNGKSFAPSGEDCEWFKEGFTNYYTLKALRQVDFLADETYLDFMANFFYGRYSSDTGLGELSMSQGEEKHDHWGLIYGGGMFVSIAQDMIIRTATNNERNIDDLMRQLFDTYGGTNQTYTIEELQSIMSELSGSDQSEFFNAHVLGADEIPVADYLAMAGLEAEVDNGQLRLSQPDQLTAQQTEMMKGMFGELD